MCSARACPALLPRCLLWLRLPRTARTQRWPLELSQRREMCVYLSGVEHDEALRRVLGLVRWDAAAELKEKIGLAGSEMAQQLRKPGELLEKEVSKVPGAFAKVPGALKRIAWATPACVALERLPTFEQLCTRAWCITTCTDSGVAQYLRVHPTAATWPVGPGVAVPEPTDDTVLGRTAAS
mmetsp:Transcript_20902/g.49722  ORF Transcript_20902/g.49722 Transcript_20902/m.49722 type:complete len:181 (-) Transcript_20902:604-1146(-)